MTGVKRNKNQTCHIYWRILNFSDVQVPHAFAPFRVFRNCALLFAMPSILNFPKVRGVLVPFSASS